MIFIFITIQLFAISHALQTGYTCESLINLTCPQSKKLIILEVSYSTACIKSSIYAPSRCIARHREPISSKCNGFENCTIDNNPLTNPSFNINLNANCAFQGQSINIEYSCIQEKNDLPSIDICSNELIENIQEGFIYSPNYPKDYGMNLNCSKIISISQIGHRLKIYAIRLNTKSIIRLSSKGPKRIDDWLEINNNGEKITSLGRKSYSLLYDDIIDVNLKFKTESITSKQDFIGFLLYFIITPIRRSRPAIIPLPSKTTTDVAFETQKSALIIDKKDKQSNIILILIITLLAAVLIISIVGFLIYKRGTDRRVRYLEEAFQSFNPQNSKTKFVEEIKEFDKSEHIYSDDPLNHSSIYEHIDDYDIIKSKQINI